MTEKRTCRCGYALVKDWQTGEYREANSTEIAQAKFVERMLVFWAGFGVAFLLCFFAWRWADM